MPNAGFAMPRGYPHTVTPDYLPYQLWAVPSHITGWVSTSLATSSLLKAVGVGVPSAVGTAAASAAIKWITKDGIGAAGRLLVGATRCRPHSMHIGMSLCSAALQPGLSLYQAMSSSRARACKVLNMFDRWVVAWVTCLMRIPSGGA